MCGICGVHRFGDAPISLDTINLLMVNNQNRGLEAAGVALQQADGSVQILKNDCTAYALVTSQEYRAFMDENLRKDTVTVLGHTRKATKGTPRVIANNHPMFAGQTAVVHNGQITTDDWAFKEWKLDRKAETDSDILRAVLDAEGFTRKAINMMSRLAGNAAFAAVSTKYPGKLLLGRSGNPLETYADKDHFIFSSERSPLYKVIRPLKTVYGVVMREMSPTEYYMIGMTDNTAWLFSDKSKGGHKDWADDYLEWHQEMKIATNYTAPNYQCNLQYHGSRVKFYDDRPVDVVQCLNSECGMYMSVNSAMLKDLKKYRCGACKTLLG
jgi:glucosamine 6-phosphate synthetase-like amidotransferase/phosphosugar isomerase protein